MSFAASTFHSSACPTPATADRQIFFGVNTYGVSRPPHDGVLIEPASASGAATITRIMGIKNAQLLDGRCGRVRSLPATCGPARRRRRGRYPRRAEVRSARVRPAAGAANPERRERIGSESTDGWTLLMGASTDDDARRFCKIGAMMEEILRPKGTQYDTG